MKIKKQWVSWEEFEAAQSGIWTPADHAPSHHSGADDPLDFASIDGFGTYIDQALLQASNVIFTSVTVGNQGIHILDTNASHDLILTTGSDLTADKTLAFNTGDVARIISFQGDPTLSDWFDQDVKTTATPTFNGVGFDGNLDVKSNDIVQVNLIAFGISAPIISVNASDLLIVPAAGGNVNFFDACTSGENPYVYIYGYDTGTVQAESMRINVNASGDGIVLLSSGSLFVSNDMVVGTASTTVENFTLLAEEQGAGFNNIIYHNFQFGDRIRWRFYASQLSAAENDYDLSVQVTNAAENAYVTCMTFDGIDTTVTIQNGLGMDANIDMKTNDIVQVGILAFGVATPNMTADGTKVDFSGGADFAGDVTTTGQFYCDTNFRSSDARVILQASSIVTTGYVDFNGDSNSIVVPENSGYFSISEYNSWDLRFRVTANGKVFINEDANTKMTQGLTINQGASDDDILAFKSSTCAHGITDVSETDTYGAIKQAGSGTGGVRLRGLSEVVITTRIEAIATADNTDKDATATAPIYLVSAKKNGTAAGDVGANGNLVTMGNQAATRFIFDEDGDMFYDGAAPANYDQYDDAIACHDLQRHLYNLKRPASERLTDFIQYNKSDLVNMGVVSEGGFVSTKGLATLQLGAISQLHNREKHLEARIEELEGKIKQLEA